MAKTETISTRSPRGTKPVSDAFLAALESVPLASRAVVAKAAQAMIRDELKVQRDRIKAAGIKQKTAQPAAAKTLAATKASTPVKAPIVAKSATKAKAAPKKASAPALKTKTLKTAEPSAEIAPKKPAPKKTAAVKDTVKPAETSAAA